MEAGELYNVSPLHLASRVKQEGGTKETYDAVSGNSNLTYDGKSLKGAYNYYNIGAYGDVPVARGLAVAKGYIGTFDGTPWDTREKAIKFGAKFIANDYISKGQYTMYFQKWNVAPNASYTAHTHQYMTNITAPASEALSTYYTYTDLNMMNTPFVFSIPIYNDMPNEFTVHPLVGDMNNNLSSIKIDGKDINGFDSDVITYTHYIASNATKVNVEAIAASQKSTITGLGEILVPNNETNITINVKSESGQTKTYSIKLIKTADIIEVNPLVEEILNKVDIKLTASYMSGIVEKTTATSLANSINKQGPKATVKITDKDKKDKTTALATGDIITITSGTDIKTYTIVIKGDTDGNGIIDIKDLLRVQKHILKSSLLTGAFKESCDTDYNGVIDIKDLLRVQKHILKDIVLK